MHRLYKANPWQFSSVKFISAQFSSVQFSSVHVVRSVCALQGECDAALGAEFVFSVRSKELIIGDVYVRIYNEQPTFPLEVTR